MFYFKKEQNIPVLSSVIDQSNNIQHLFCSGVAINHQEESIARLIFILKKTTTFESKFLEISVKG
jgi:hypothetical protein